jgi:hypothetical protein
MGRHLLMNLDKNIAQEIARYRDALACGNVNSCR